MTVQDNWDVKFSVNIDADDIESVKVMLREVLEKLENGETEGDGNYCAGAYEFGEADDEQSMVDRLRNLVNDGDAPWYGSLKNDDNVHIHYSRVVDILNEGD